MMMSEGARLKSVKIYFISSGYTNGLLFFSTNHRLILKVGWTNYSESKVETLMLAENEVIIGLAVNLYEGSQSIMLM